MKKKVYYHRVENMRYPLPFQHLSLFWQRLPGVGPRSAERFSLDLINWSKEELFGFASALNRFAEEIVSCETCGALRDESGCPFCSRLCSAKQLCIVGGQRELFHIESAKIFQGLYHVLPSLLSTEEDDRIEEELEKIKGRIESLEIEEVILALEGTLEGDATSHLLAEELKESGVKLTRIAFGLPMGSSFSSVDGGTLTRSFVSRQPID